MAGLGMYFCAGTGHSPRMVLLRAKHAQRALEQVAEISAGSDANLTVQVLFSLTSTTLHSRWIDSARKCLTKTCIVLNAANLRFIPATDRPPGLTEGVRERAVVFSQVIYLESYVLHLAVLCDLISRSEPDSKPRMDAICIRRWNDSAASRRE